ncbi:MAG: 23S rRNA (uracil(1939)-C(5))-methyltransferase RlmD [Candidatus Omnitrophica bacterium]|nr:23S rRNA (uracil(1939)-C(5))-methyltransferase RlmD [Candidatus Omnitrophota bacterium]
MQIQIQKIVYPGRSLSAQEGKVIFTDEGLPGELVEIEILKEKKNYLEARTVRVVEPSPHRVKPRCDHYKICSPYQCIDYPFQLEIKAGQIKEIFSHDLKIDLSGLRVTASEKEWGYRNKIHLHILWDKDKPRFAYHEAESLNTFVEIEKCFLISDEANSLLALFLKAAEIQKLRSVEEVTIRESSYNKEMLIVLYASSAKHSGPLQKIAEELKSEFPLRGVICIVRKERSVDEIIISGDDEIEERIDDKIFRLGPESFFQINTGVLKELIKDMRGELSLAGKETLADFYTGIGTFGIALASEVREVIGVESSAENTAFLRKNIGLNGVKNFKVCEGAAEEWLSKTLSGKVDALIVDPPRKGIGEAMSAKIVEAAVPLIVYISCNPSTLVRDLKILLGKYSLKRLQAYDFFPQTPHIETCAILTR